jgi:hypothetical protein
VSTPAINKTNYQPANGSPAAASRNPAAGGSAPELSFHLFRDADGNLHFVDAQGGRTARVRPVRLFPMSDPHRWIALCDPSGREIACIDDPQKLPEDVRQVLATELDRRNFLPVVQRIIQISAASPCEWHVETDRGTTRFLLNSDDDVHSLGEHRLLVVDSHGIRYLIPDTRTLDAASRRQLNRYF